MSAAPSTKIGDFQPVRVPARRPGPTGGKREQNRARRTQEIANAALDLFLARGIERVTIEEITTATGISKGSFYRYFDSKAHLVAAMFGPMSDAVEQTMHLAGDAIHTAQSRDALLAVYRGLGEGLLTLLLPEPRLVRLYLQECRGPADGARVPVRQLADRIGTAALELTRQAHARGLLADLPPHVISPAIVGAVEALLFRLVEGADVGDPHLAAEALIRMVLDGIASRR
jgi:AcrR family transcriptional regulator